MGVFGAGNAGSALTKLIAPSIIAISTWQLGVSTENGKNSTLRNFVEYLQN